MDTKRQIAFYKKQKASAEVMKEVASQNYQLAAQLESEADSALALLGNKPERARKGEVLSKETQLALAASLTR